MSYYQLLLVTLSCLTCKSDMTTEYSNHYKKALDSYTSLCGPMSCRQSNTTKIIAEDRPAICKKCSCSPYCLMTRSCCLDYFLGLPERTHFDGIIHRNFNASNFFGYESPGKPEAYRIVKNCPSTSDYEIERKCAAARDVVSRIKSLPVTSSNTYLTYDNINCAKCHNDYTNVEQWMLKVDFKCSQETDLNMMNSFNEIVEFVDKHNCTISTIPNIGAMYIETRSHIPQLSYQSAM